MEAVDDAVHHEYLFLGSALLESGSLELLQHRRDDHVKSKVCEDHACFPTLNQLQSHNIILTLKAPGKMHLKMSSAEVVCCK